MPTVLHRLALWAETDPQAPAQRFKSKGAWKTITAKEYSDRVFHLALFLESKGITSKEICAVLAYNSPQWVHLDLATSLMGGMTAGLYPNSSVKDIQYILNHTEATVLGVQDKDYYKKILGNGEGSVPERI